MFGQPLVMTFTDNRTANVNVTDNRPKVAPFVAAPRPLALHYVPFRPDQVSVPGVVAPAVPAPSLLRSWLPWAAGAALVLTVSAGAYIYMRRR
jgi:hypothetical protein